MLKKQSIILGYYRQGKSKKALAKDLGVSVKTVRKYLRAYEKECSEVPNKSSPKEGLLHQSIIDKPIYDSSTRTHRKLNEKMKVLIDSYLASNKSKRSQGLHKQCMRGTDIHEALQEGGYSISYSTVIRYIQQQDYRTKEVFIRQEYEAGKSVEFDWGYVKLKINGVEKQLMLAVYTAAYSNHRWSMLFHRQDMSSFLYAHRCYFEAVGGVAQELVYDNTRTAVRKFARRNVDKIATEELLKLSSYYQFSIRFCNARKGNEKGKVERSVEFVRRKAFCRTDEFASLEAANAHLSQKCTSLNTRPLSGKNRSRKGAAIQTVFKEELSCMRPSPPPYDTADLRHLRVDKYSCVRVDNNWYSVPEGLVGKMVLVKVYPHYLLIYDQTKSITKQSVWSSGTVLARHERQHSRFEYYLHLEHYLATLHRKPGALLGALSFKQADQRLRQIFKDYFEHKAKDFIDLLAHMQQRNYTITQLCGAVQVCTQTKAQQVVSLDKLKILLANQVSKNNVFQRVEIDKKQISISDRLASDGETISVVLANKNQIHQHCKAQLESIQALFAMP